ncbi:MAG: hypothetical protein JJU27_18375 [Gammaproteobacteria bacterium]|nr:hypothetical protein [Gammaproteobacteria bacterium]
MVLVLLVLAVFPSASDAGQDPPKLIMTDVDPEHLERIRAHNGNNFERAIYFAKRWRVVEVNPDILFPNRAVRVRLFADADFVLRRIERPGERNADLSWAAIHDYPTVPAQIQTRRKRSQAFVDAVLERFSGQRTNEQVARHDARIEANFGVIMWRVDERTGVAEDVASLTFPHLPPPTAVDEPDLSDAQRHSATPPAFRVPVTKEFLQLHGTITDPVENKTYWIRELDFSPRYHLVLELDPSKFVRNLPPGADRDLAEARALEFEANLPPDEYPEIRGTIE